MPQPLDYLHESASQTAGPFLHIGLMPEAAGIRVFDRAVGATVAGPDVPGERIVIEGLILDGTGEAVRDAVVETWQADAAGRFAGTDGAAPGFRGLGRTACDAATGLWRLATVKPGPVATAAGGAMAPHVAVLIFARGINLGLLTRLLFADEAEANAACPVLSAVPPGRRDTLIAAREADGPPARYRFDIRLQGERETVFLDA